MSGPGWELIGSGLDQGDGTGLREGRVGGPAEVDDTRKVGVHAVQGGIENISKERGKQVF